MILRDRNFRHCNKIGGKISGREVRGLVTSKIILHFHLLLPIYRGKKTSKKTLAFLQGLTRGTISGREHKIRWRAKIWFILKKISIKR